MAMARERPEGVFVVGKAVCPCTVCLLPSQGTSFKFADLAPHCGQPIKICVPPSLDAPNQNNHPVLLFVGLRYETSCYATFRPLRQKKWCQAAKMNHKYSQPGTNFLLYPILSQEPFFLRPWKTGDMRQWFWTGFR